MGTLNIQNNNQYCTALRRRKNLRRALGHQRPTSSCDLVLYPEVNETTRGVIAAEIEALTEAINSFDPGEPEFPFCEVQE